MNEHVFLTERLPLASYIHASNRLKFLRCELIDKHRVVFVFADPNDRGELIEAEYNQGVTVNPAVLFSSIKYLRTQITLTQRGAEVNGNR